MLAAIAKGGRRVGCPSGLRRVSSVASPSPVPPQVTPDALKARQPKPDAWKDSRVTYRGGLYRSKGRSWVGILMGRWRGTTIDLNHDFRLWHRHEEAARHVRLWAESFFLSQTLHRAAFPDLALVGAIAAAVVSWNQHVLHAAFAADPAGAAAAVSAAGGAVALLPGMAALPAEPFALSSFALGLLVNFRVQECHGRYVEARMLWGDLVNVSRDLASRVLHTLKPTTAVDCAERERAVRLVRTFPRTVKYHLSVDGFNEDVDIRGCSDADVLGAKDARLRDELAVIWTEEEAYGPAGAPPGAEGPKPDTNFADRLLREEVRSRPLWVIQELGEVVSRARARGSAGPVEASILDNRILAYNNVLGAMERIMRTPIYRSYSHHTGRFVMLWCAAIPAAIYPIMGPAATVPTALLLSYMMLGIEDIGSRVECPWPSLPMWQYADTICDGVVQMRDQDAEKIVRARAGAVQPAKAPAAEEPTEDEALAEALRKAFSATAAAGSGEARRATGW